ncbi:hypothetical protein ABTZ03_37245 [Kitasatospora sp. NPDC096077]|uniref:hypothetical protein n=1 Tax=Kitasatospora sp. NPDC096077 TaxID=3155544 RepID=UPI00331D2746
MSLTFHPHALSTPEPGRLVVAVVIIIAILKVPSDLLPTALAALAGTLAALLGTPVTPREPRR